MFSFSILNNVMLGCDDSQGDSQSWLKFFDVLKLWMCSEISNSNLGLLDSIEFYT